MAAHSRTLVAWGFGLVAAGGLLSIALSTTAVAHHTAPTLPDYGRLPEFSLIDHEQRPISRSALAGSVWIANFIFTRCAVQCPIMSAQMAALQRELHGLAAVRFVSFSVDPSYDTPERLAAYAAHSGTDADRWRFVTEAGTPPGEPGGITGPITTIHALAQQGFRLGFTEEGSADEPITHSVRLILVDQRGAIRGSYDATDAQAIATLGDDARRLAHLASRDLLR